MASSSAGQTRSRTTARVRAHSMLASAVRSGIAARSTPAVITGQGYADRSWARSGTRRPPSRNADRHLMVGDPLIPPAECPPGRFLDHGLLVIVPGETAHRAHAGEPRDGGEQDLLALVPAEQLGAAEAIDALQVRADLGFVMALVVIGGRPRRPSAPYPRDHADLISARPGQVMDDKI